jgi:hypothetical protein
MNREKEILLQLLLEKYKTTTAEIKVNPLTEIKTNLTTKQKAVRRREPAIYANVHWTVADVAAVDQGKKQGMSVETIAKNIGRSKKSVLAIVKMLDGRYAYTRPIVLQYLALKNGK